MKVFEFVVWPMTAVRVVAISARPLVTEMCSHLAVKVVKNSSAQSTATIFVRNAATPRISAIFGKKINEKMHLLAIFEKKKISKLRFFLPFSDALGHETHKNIDYYG